MVEGSVKSYADTKDCRRKLFVNMFLPGCVAVAIFDAFENV